MGIEKVTQQQRFTSDNVIVGADSDPLDTGLSVYGKITNTERISSQGEIYTDQNLIATGNISAKGEIYADQNLIATGNISATDASFKGFLYVTGGIVAPGLKTDISPDAIKINDANLNDVLKVTENSGVTAYAPSRVNIEELSSTAISLLDGATINYDRNNQTFVVKNPEETIVYESSYIKQLAKSTCIDTQPGFAAITNDSRVIAWGFIPQNIFGSTTNVLPSENIRVPFWAQYDGALSGGDFRPYGGDIIDSLTGTGIVDLYWSNNCAMALLTSTNPEYDGSVWVAGKNMAGLGVSPAMNPQSLVKNKYGGIFIVNTTTTNTSVVTGGVIGNTGVFLLNAEKDVCAIQKYNSTPQNDIIIDKTNSDDLSAESYYYISSITNGNLSANIKRVNHYGELISTHYHNLSANRLGAPTGIAMSISAVDGKNLLYVCDISANQSKVKIFDITNNTLSSLPLISAIGTGLKNHTDGSTDSATLPAFHTLRRIAIDPTNSNILYVTDENRIKRIYRKTNGHYKVNTISNTNPGDNTGTFSAAISMGTARFNTPAGIAVSKNGKFLYIADSVNKKIQKVTITTNDENNFDGISEYYVDTNIDTVAEFNAPTGLARDNNGNLFIADSSNHVIRKINYDISNKSYGKVTTIAGASANNDGKPATVAANIKNTIGKLSAAQFSTPQSIIYVSNENALYVTNAGTHSISRIDLTLSSVSAIGSQQGYLSGEGLSGGKATFYKPINLCYGERNSKKYIWVINNSGVASTYHYIKQVEILGNHNYKITNLTNTTSSTKSSTTTLLTTNAIASATVLAFPYAIAYDNVSDSLYFSNKYYCIQKLQFSDNKIYTVAGSDNTGNQAGMSLSARFGIIQNIELSGNDLFAVDSSNKKIWKIENFRDPLSSNRIVFEYTGSGGSSNKIDSNGYGAEIRFSSPQKILNGNDNDFVISTGNYIKRLFNIDNINYLETINGSGVAKYSNTITNTLSWAPYGLFSDNEDKLFFTEQVRDEIGYIENKKLFTYKNMPAGGLGIGAGYDKTTCGFIMVKAKDAENKVPKFKQIQMVCDKPTITSGRITAIFAALDQEDSLWLWGYSPDGAFGNGFINEMGPTKIYQFEKNVKEFNISCATSSGGNTTLISIITKDNKLFSAGDNTMGQLGRGSSLSADQSFRIFRQCKKTDGFVNDANKLIDSNTIGYKNNLYISTLSTVWACGDHSNGVLGRGPLSEKDIYFKEVDNLTNVKQLLATSNTQGTTIYSNVFALTEEGSVWAWGYNKNGVCLINSTADTYINTPTPCYDFESRDLVKGANYLISNKDPVSGHFKIAYLDNLNNLYIGGYKTDVEVPSLPLFIPYFRKFNMKNIMNDLCIVNEFPLVRKGNGTVYTINSFGAKKVF